MKNIIMKTILIFAAIVLFGIGNHNVHAQDKIGVDISGDNNKIINEDSVYPGWSKKKTVEITNYSDTSAVDLYLNFKLNKGNALADKLKIYVINSKGVYKIGGAGDKYTLKKADDEGQLFVEKLDIGESEIYQIKIKLDKDAGNELQGKTSKFDVDFTIEGEATEGLTEAQILTNQKRAVTGEKPDDEKEDDKNKQISAITSNGIDGSDGSVAGVETCNSWPLWTWVIMLIVYGVFTYLIGRSNENIVDSKRNIFWQVLSLLSALLVWYFFDTCRTYIWTPVLLVIGGVVLISILFNKKEKIKTPTK